MWLRVSLGFAAGFLGAGWTPQTQGLAAQSLGVRPGQRPLTALWRKLSFAFCGLVSKLVR